MSISGDEASPEHLTRGTTKYADVMLTVVEPYFKSLETGRRMAELAYGLGIERVVLIANKVRDDAELEAVKEFAAKHDLEIAGVIPFDESMPGAEHADQRCVLHQRDEIVEERRDHLADGLGNDDLAHRLAWLMPGARSFQTPPSAALLRL